MNCDRWRLRRAIGNIAEMVGACKAVSHPRVSCPVPRHPDAGATTVGQHLAQQSMAMSEMAPVKTPYPRLVCDGVGAGKRHERSKP